MANDEHLALLRQGTTIWNKWRERNPDDMPDLGRANLGTANLSRANLSRANLRRANLIKADFSEARLSDADLRGTMFSGANLIKADLSEARLSNADLRGADLTGAKLSRADFTWADLSGADFSWANLGGANFDGAILSETHLGGAILIDSIFTNVDLTETNGLDKCNHHGPSTIDFRTLYQSKNLPISFLRGCGLPENLIEYLPSFRDEAIRFYSCFVSYSAKDQIFVERLHADLQNKGVRCWFAPHDLPIGAKTWDAIDEAIRLRDKLLLILSEASIASEWVEDEVSKAYAEERSRKEVVLFPIRIDNAVISAEEPWAVKLKDQRNIGDFRQWKKPAEYQKSLDRLLRDLKVSGVK